MAHSVYYLRDACDRLLYIGVSKNPMYRFFQHQNKHWIRDVVSASYEWFDSRDEALARERSQIKSLSPIWNGHHSARGSSSHSIRCDVPVDAAEEAALIEDWRAAGVVVRVCAEVTRDQMNRWCGPRNGSDKPKKLKEGD